MYDTLPPIVKDFIVNLRNKGNRDNIRYNSFLSLLNIQGEVTKAINEWDKEQDKKLGKAK